MRKDLFEYNDNATVCEGFIASDGSAGKKPCVLIAHQWAGIGVAEFTWLALPIPLWRQQQHFRSTSAQLGDDVTVTRQGVRPARPLVIDELDDHQICLGIEDALETGFFVPGVTPVER